MVSETLSLTTGYLLRQTLLFAHRVLGLECFSVSPRERHWLQLVEVSMSHSIKVNHHSFTSVTQRYDHENKTSVSRMSPYRAYLSESETKWEAAAIIFLVLTRYTTPNVRVPTIHGVHEGFPPLFGTMFRNA